jgi:predicted esterase
MHPLLRYARCAALCYESDADIAAQLPALGLALVGVGEDATKWVYHGPKGTLAYAAIDEGTLVISVRGSCNRPNFETDADCFKVPFGLFYGCPIHKGFHDDTMALWGWVCTVIQLFQRNKGTLRCIVFDGHSLGAALAQALTVAAWLHVGVAAISAYLYGCPRVGGRAYHAKVKNHLSAYPVFIAARMGFPDPITRLVHADDIVPHLPWWLLGFRHVGKLIRIDDDGNTRTVIHHWWRRLLGYGKRVVADVDFQGVRDHFMNNELPAIEKYVARLASGAKP